jgi:hypothetical protein
MAILTADSTRPVMSLLSCRQVNTLSIVSIVLVAAATMGIAMRTSSWGPIFWGFTVLVIPAVGAGHVALQQIKMRRESGAILAYIALGICYLFAAYELVSSVYYGIVTVTS